MIFQDDHDLELYQPTNGMALESSGFGFSAQNGIPRQR
jgi:hypothetical protein